MNPEPSPLLEDDLELARGAAAGSVEDLLAIRTQHADELVRFLVSRGATIHDAEDLVAGIFAEAVADADDPNGSLFAKYAGRAPLGSWLRTIAINRFYSLMRRRRFEIQPADGEPSAPSAELAPLASGSGSVGGSMDSPDLALARLLERSLQHALQSLEPEKLLLLRLAYLHGIDQRRLAALWSIHEANVSRAIAGAMATLRTRALAHLKEQEEVLDLGWDELLEVCRTFNLEQIFSET